MNINDLIVKIVDEEIMPIIEGKVIERIKENLGLVEAKEVEELPEAKKAPRVKKPRAKKPIVEEVAEAVEVEKAQEEPVVEVTGLPDAPPPPPPPADMQTP